MRNIISFSVKVDTPTQLVAKPKRKKVLNSFDYNANMLGINRIEGENNSELRDRIWDASVHPSGPLYEGVLNGIARDLGMLRQPVVSVDLKVSSGGSPIATSPRVDILANRIILYSDWRPNGTAVIDKEIHFYQPDSVGFYLEDLIAEINTSSSFSASMIDGVRPNMHSTSLVKRTSHIFVPSELIRSDRRTLLSYKYIAKDGLFFQDKDTFSTETLIDPSSSGEYLVDYVDGIITSHNLPKPENGVSYHANEFPFQIDAAPVQVFNLNDDDFTTELFEKETLDSSEEINALPNHEGSEIYHQLYLQSKVFWGN